MKNIRIFEKFVNDREHCEDWSLYLSNDKSKLSKIKIINSCGLNRSALYQNAKVSLRFAEIEKALHKRGILKTHEKDKCISTLDDKTCLLEIQKIIGALDDKILEFSTEIDSAVATISDYDLPG
ncbi:hypothetical protein ACNKU7_05645 [Microbulbifer sp. SA54]|uniref:hypothetical protein n=1 Tax=Microbulbifer sp. SA54 TaxID=3401577 RepID=UPI003AAAF65A